MMKSGMKHKHGASALSNLARHDSADAPQGSTGGGLTKCSRKHGAPAFCLEAWPLFFEMSTCYSAYKKKLGRQHAFGKNMHTQRHPQHMRHLQPSQKHKDIDANTHTHTHGLVDTQTHAHRHGQTHPSGFWTHFATSCSNCPRLPKPSWVAATKQSKQRIPTQITLYSSYPKRVVSQHLRFEILGIRCPRWLR
jgi:hypothetical protein